MAGDPTDGYHHFPKTPWTLVARAGGAPEEGGGGGGEDGREQHAALAALLEMYLAPLLSHLRFHIRLDRDEAQDVLQSFLADKVLAGDLIRHARHERGRFRRFLQTSLDNFAFNQIRDRRALKRSPAERPSPAGRSPAAPASAAHAPDDGFDVAWAKQVLSLAVQAMRDECRALDRPDVWGVFEGRILGPARDDQEPTPYAELVRRFGFRSPSHASNVLVTANRMFARLLREVVGAYAKEGADLDEEIVDLRRILSSACARSDEAPCTLQQPGKSPDR